MKPLPPTDRPTPLRANCHHWLKQLARQYEDDAADEDWDMKREALQDYLMVLVTLLDTDGTSQDDSRIMFELMEALAFAQEDRMHPLFHAKAPSLQQTRSEGMVEAVAAGVLEWGVEELLLKEVELADQIATALARAGYNSRQKNRSRYSGWAVIEWRKRYREGRGGPAQRLFGEWLDHLRAGSHDTPAEALELLVSWLS